MLGLRELQGPLDPQGQVDLVGLQEPELLGRQVQADPQGQVVPLARLVLLDQVVRQVLLAHLDQQVQELLARLVHPGRQVLQGQVVLQVRVLLEPQDPLGLVGLQVLAVRRGLE